MRALEFTAADFDRRQRYTVLARARETAKEIVLQATRRFIKVGDESTCTAMRAAVAHLDAAEQAMRAFIEGQS